MSTGYGRTTWCLDRLQTGRSVSGVQALSQAIYRRLTTPRGTLRGGAEESVYGLDLRGYVGSVSADAVVASLPAIIRGELLKDDRITDVLARVSASANSDGTTNIVVAIEVTPANASESFTLTLSVSDVSVSVLGGVV